MKNSSKSSPVLQVDKITGEILKEWPSVVSASLFLSNGTNKYKIDKTAIDNPRLSSCGYRWIRKLTNFSM